MTEIRLTVLDRLRGRATARRPLLIHWAAYDAATGELATWGSASHLESVSNQIDTARREHDGWLDIKQLDRELWHDRTDLQDFQCASREARSRARVRNALIELAGARRAAQELGIDTAALIADHQAHEHESKG